MFDIIAIDWGHVRTGLAFVSSSTGLIVPYSKDLNTIDLKSVLKNEIELKKITRIVLGKPTNFKLQNTEVTEKIIEFSEYIKETYPKIKIGFVNENGSSKLSKDGKDKHSINHLSAMEIGKRFLSK
jgi:RNase H-fold protein (predicted Holliday junction resolvase)